jgi:alpha-L-fucosidase 2
VLAQASVADSGLLLWDDGPAPEWDEAYAVGNGRIGALPLGDYPAEKILLNEETIWSRTEPMLVPADSFEHLETIRRLEAAGEYQAADEHFVANLQDGRDPDSYQLAGWLELRYLDTAAQRSTRRELDLNTGISTSIHTLDNGSRLVQKVFASAPDDVILISVTGENRFGLRVALDGSRVDDGDLILDGAGTGDDATRFRVRARVSTDGALLDVDGGINITSAREVRIIIAIATDLDRHIVGAKLADGWQAAALDALQQIAGRSVDSLQAAAVADHRQYFDRTKLVRRRSTCWARWAPSRRTSVSSTAAKSRIYRQPSSSSSKTTPIDSNSTPSASASCRVCRGPLICLSRSRSSRAPTTS